MQISDIKQIAERIKSNISKVLVEADETIELVIIALICGGHVLIEDVPGVGKTMLAKCLAKSIDCDFKRIQFTPDLLPSELTGINYFDQKQSRFIFRQGPLFSNIVLADEINRATPRTQSSLLECMEECQITVDGDTRKLKRPFFVIATQNPVETRGTFPLPEAQLDRFFMRLHIGYPSRESSMELLQRFRVSDPTEDLKAITDGESVIDMQKSFPAVKVSEAVLKYIIDIVEMTRDDTKITMGVSPRGSIALMKASQALAILEGREYVIPDDVKKAAVPVLAHRLLLRGHAIAGGTQNSEAAICEILKRVPVPTEEPDHSGR